MTNEEKAIQIELSKGWHAIKARISMKCIVSDLLVALYALSAVVAPFAS
jgi:hypothetical protein